jgi:putative tricarboxylic transport membrane protein
VFWGLIASMYIGNVMLIILNIPLVGVFVSLLRIPFRILFPVILLICLVGTYSVNTSTFELAVLLFFGILGYFIRKIKYDMAPLILAVIIGPTMEMSLRQALMRSDGSFLIFWESPITMVLITTSCLLLCWNIYRALRPTTASWEKALEEG